ncbi:MAG: sigma-54 dependent transcriptional regulator [Candidatus Binatia bacterium]
MKRVLIVDDDRRMRRTLQILVERMGLASAAAADAHEAQAQLRGGRFDLVLTDLKLPGPSGLDLLDEIRAAQPALPVVLLTAYGTIQTAIEAIRRGAADFVLKPFDNGSLELVLRKTLDRERASVENDFLKAQVDASWAPGQRLAALPGLRDVAAMIEKVAPASGSVLISGETGTGKELAARALHARSPRRDALFVPLNCAALPAELLEAELFGHVRGAFTGADRDRKGKFEVADGGTLFLDEIGDMPMALQAKLLRVLEDGSVERVGGNSPTRVDVRIVSATNQDLPAAIAAKRFRDDLFYRLNTFELRLPPLRERPDDVAVLAPLLLERFARELGKTPPRLADEALAVLRGYAWPGNVRELRNLMERVAVLAGDAPVTGSVCRAMLQLQPAPPPAEPSAAGADGGATLGAAMDRFERHLLLQVLDQAGDNKAEAARRLGVSERTLWYKLKKHGL